MFYQVRVSKADRDVLRFFWWPSGDLTQRPKVYRMTVHVFGATSSPSCVNFVLRRTATDFATSSNKEAAESLKRNCYMDDLMKGLDKEENAIQFAGDVVTLGEKGSFKFTKWASNNQAVIDSVPAESKASSVKSLGIDSLLPSEKVLGIA